MASKTQIVNLALVLLGEENVLSIDDDVKTARAMRQVYDIALDSLLGGYNWSFAMARQLLPATADAPAFDFANKFSLPPTCLRVVYIGDYYVGVDLSDYRSGPASEFMIEGREILTDWGSPLKLRFVKRITDTAAFQPVFTEAFAAKLACMACEKITQSTGVQSKVDGDFARAIRNAVRANAIELPPEKLPDDEWILCRR